MSTAGMKKVTCPIFDGHDYPKWKAMMRKRLMAMNSERWTVTEIGLTDLCKMADTDVFASTLDLTSWRRISSVPAYQEMNSGALCIFAMRSLSGTKSLTSMKVIELVMIPGLMISRNHSKR